MRPFGCPPRARSGHASQFTRGLRCGNAEKAQGILGFSRTLKLTQIRLRELAKCFIGACLEGLRGRKRNFLGERCEFFGLLGQRFELLA
jgi:hypothetical protein